MLIVEDDEILATLVAKLLERNELSYEIARDGAEAIERLTVSESAAVVLDLMMPKVDGFGVVDWIRDNRPTLLPRVIVMTATSDQQLSRLRVSELGGLIRKPFEIHELGRMIRTQLGLPSAVDVTTSTPARDTLFDAL